MSKWGELDNNDIEIVDIDVGNVEDIKDIPEDDVPVNCEWGNLSEEEMERRGQALAKRLELDDELRRMRISNLQSGAYDKNLLEPGVPLDLDEPDEFAETQEPSNLERLRAFRELVVERDPEICAILERMNDSTDEDPPQKVLKLR